MDVRWSLARQAGLNSAFASGLNSNFSSKTQASSSDHVSSLSQGKRNCGKEWSSGRMCILLRAAGAVAPRFGVMPCHIYCQRTCFSGPLLLCFLTTLHLLDTPELLFGSVFLCLWSEGVYGLVPHRPQSDNMCYILIAYLRIVSGALGDRDW